uniref:Uncharacterized protein n=1 Tax=Ixodes ricinus TaxID=34613 RepID=A0A6B0UCM8_IXORI
MALTCCAFSASVMSSFSVMASALFLAFSSLLAARCFLRALASATFLMGRAFTAFSCALYSATISAVTGMCLRVCFFSSSVNHFGRFSSLKV